MTVRVWLVSFVAAGALAAQVETAESPFRKELRHGLPMVIRAGRERFRPMQGARIDIRPGNETWFEARYDLPEASSCRVYEHPPTYVCRWERAMGRADPAAFFRSLTADIETVLGERWERSGTGEIRFRDKEEGVTVTIVLAGGAVRLTVAPGVRRRPQDDPVP